MIAVNSLLQGGLIFFVFSLAILLMIASFRKTISPDVIKVFGTIFLLSFFLSMSFVIVAAIISLTI
ncbi:MAG: hypothetical protein HDQ88_04935 [Clostridia bacterium]|nr:hypothetical protein [Clostridia bacterium]